MNSLLLPIAALLLVTSAAAYFNYYVLRLPRNAGLLLLAFLISLLLRLADLAFPSAQSSATLATHLNLTNFGGLLLNVFLAFLLFAGALNVDVRELFDRKWTILALATVGVLVSTLIIAGGLYGIFRLVGLNVPFAYCLVFGALISPTDPVTVLDALSRGGVPSRLRAVIAGESLFNDGIGIVLFTLFLPMAINGGGDLDLGHAALDFVREAGGGLLLGLATGAAAFVAMRGIDEYNIELMISLTLVTGTYGLAQALNVSGPVAEVVAGLMMGSVGVKYAVSGTTHDYLQKFWSLTDELLNALLFLIIGLEFAVVDLSAAYVTSALAAIPLALFARVVSIALASLPLNMGTPNKGAALTLLTWSGLRGGISVALVLSLPSGDYREALVTVCYGLALFTMLVQGLTLGPLSARLFPPSPATELPPAAD